MCTGLPWIAVRYTVGIGLAVRDGLREIRTTALGFESLFGFALALFFAHVDGEPNVTSFAHGCAILGTGRAGRWKTVVACAYVGCHKHENTQTSMRTILS